MAIYRLSAKLVKRSEGQSVIASAAYRAGIVMSDMRTGQLHDYTRRRGVVYAEVLAPPDTPDWMLDRIQLWNAVEVVEKRKDAQLARELQLALPHELTPRQRLDLVLGFARSAFVAQGMIADVVVHQPDRRGDERNHHAHVLLTLRSIIGDGFGPKARAWNDTALLEGWRSDWSDATNRALAQHGHAERVDHRSYAERGIDREPEPKMGPVATTMERNGHVSHAGDDRRAAQARNQRRAELAASLVGIGTELAVTEGVSVMAVPVRGEKEPPTRPPMSSSPCVPVPTETAGPARRRSRGVWKRYLFALWTTVARAVTMPVRALAEATLRQRSPRRPSPGR